MLIDWFTVIAQVVNFLVLAALLKYFLYDRVVSAMDERERRVQERLNEAERRRKEADEQERTYRQRNAELEHRRRDVLADARREAESRRDDLLEEARGEVDDRRRRWLDALRREKDDFVRELGRLTIEEVYAVAGRALRDLAGGEVEARVVERFLTHADVDGEASLKKLGAEVSGRDVPLTVRSGFALSKKMRQKLTRKIHQRVAESADVSYETDSALVFGLEIRAPGHSIAWHAADYLETLRERAGRLFDTMVREGDRQPDQTDARTGGHAADNDDEKEAARD